MYVLQSISSVNISYPAFDANCLKLLFLHFVNVKNMIYVTVNIQFFFIMFILWFFIINFQKPAQ